MTTVIGDKSVVADVLIDKKKQIIQSRRFDKLPLTGVVPLKEGTVFNLTIITKEGSRKFIYTEGNPEDLKYFKETLVDTTSLRNDLKDDTVFRKGPDVDDGDTF